MSVCAHLVISLFTWQCLAVWVHGSRFCIGSSFRHCPISADVIGERRYISVGSVKKIQTQLPVDKQISYNMSQAHLFWVQDSDFIEDYKRSKCNQLDSMVLEAATSSFPLLWTQSSFNNVMSSECTMICNCYLSFLY